MNIDLAVRITELVAFCFLVLVLLPVLVLTPSDATKQERDRNKAYLQSPVLWIAIPILILCVVIPEVLRVYDPQAIDRLAHHVIEKLREESRKPEHRHSPEENRETLSNFVKIAVGMGLIGLWECLSSYINYIKKRARRKYKIEILRRWKNECR